MGHESWRAVDMLFEGLAERNPDLRVEFILARPGAWMNVSSYLPLARSKGLIGISSPRVENRFMKLGVL